MPQVESITPIVITLDEAPNILRVVSHLQWANRVVVVDSGSTDGTLEILESFSNVEVVHRSFDTHHGQWNFALTQAHTDWVLVLDADYIMPEQLTQEIIDIPDDTPFSAFFVEFDYAVLGRVIRRSIYPARQVLLKRGRGHFESAGHTQRVVVAGESGELTGRIVHDDRKSLQRWLSNQVEYAQIEADRLTSTRGANLNWPDRVRCARLLAPPVMLIYVLFIKGCVFAGWPGWYYAFERAAAELVLSMVLLRRDIGGRPHHRRPS